MLYYKQQYNSYKCTQCECRIDVAVYKYSKANFNLSLCRLCQNKFRNFRNEPTPEAKELYLALRKRGVPAELEKFDGYKTIDIAVTEAKVNIEVDGNHHNYTSQQAIADLYRTFFSFQKGYLTVRIPNSLIKNHLERTADLVTEFLNESYSQMYDDEEDDYDENDY
jgi:very-short-patch-repair endonuclease